MADIEFWPHCCCVSLLLLLLLVMQYHLWTLNRLHSEQLLDPVYPLPHACA